MINRLMVANRGEIARRVFATCRRLGIETVAVFSDADADLPFVREADYAVRLPGNTPAETYLDTGLILGAAQSAGADAIHPGYGFLSENAEFARAVEEAGLIWVGPSPESIEQMGSKIEAKRIVAAAGVPVLDGESAAPPLLVKASAGGGGRGMRIVRDLADLDNEIAKASAEAASAFGDGTVFVEPYVENARHVEVQVVGDPVLGVVHVLGERDCSVQRRHQKVVEETPAVGLADEQRQALHDAARDAAAAIDYRGAGTVEFLVDADDPSRFYFLETNTRLQVEHPVTEAVTGLDLVEFQIAVAEGRPVEADQPLPGHGHAIEVRLYAEDGAYVPQSGRLVTFEIPHASEFDLGTRYGIRVDAGFESGSEVSTFYDAMLAKVIAWGPTREAAIRLLVDALRKAKIHGVTTNRDQLIAILTEPTFASGAATTGWLEGTELAEQQADPAEAALLCATAALVADRDASKSIQQGIPAGWRNVPSQAQVERLQVPGVEEPFAGEWVGTRDGRIEFPNADFEIRALTFESAADSKGSWRVDWVGEGEQGTCSVAFSEGLPGTRQVFVDSPRGHHTFTEVPRFTDPAAQHQSGSLLAPMPGSVISVAVEQGDQVEEGAVVLVLEAMKMQHTVTAPHAGVVAEVNVRPGAQVAAGEVLAVVAQ
ncbi:MAG: biotin carboxylase N-terminal domain-containing protein [Nocardioides sp.]|jgi:propionyl-CoA carboxylase alpha chain